jgi:hypothetical protein
VCSTLLGNSLYKYASWRWIFYLAIIVEGVSLVGTTFLYWPAPRPRGDIEKSRWQELKEIDWIGLLLFASGLAVLLTGLTWAGTTAHPWKSASTIGPIVVGGLVVIMAFAYEFLLAKNPVFPWRLVKMYRQYSLILLVLFTTGMTFYATTPLLPQGFAYMFTTDGIKIGVYSLPLNLITSFVGSVAPAVVHKIGYVKWQLVAGLVLQATFTAAAAGALYPNSLQGWIWLPSFGVPLFIYITILSYAIASLHVPYSLLGVSVGLLGTSRSAGGAVGNAILNTIFTNKANTFIGEEVVPVALSEGFSTADLPTLVPGAVLYNLGVPGALDNIPNMTPATKAALQIAVRNAYGHALRITFLASLAITLTALIAGIFVEDPSKYMTNHVQSAMTRGIRHGKRNTDGNANEVKEIKQ